MLFIPVILQYYEDVGTCQNYQFSEEKVTGGGVSKSGHRAGMVVRDHLMAVAMLTVGKGCPGRRKARQMSDPRVIPYSIPL